ncbi:MAG: hypothetical protein NTZ80_02240 [Patescibacteria group bacterium]|nr:hypothetical protein [Patescibacteria group bacterium]
MNFCTQCQSQFEVTPEDLLFYDKISPVFNGKKYQVQEPTLCPECRQKRRLSFRNERKLYWRKDDATDEKILSIYSPDKTIPIYTQKFYLSDQWDPIEKGRDFDFSRPFFEQFKDFNETVPHPSLQNDFNENSDYVNFSARNKNCYLIFEADHNQDCLYLSHSYHNRNCVDCCHIDKCELCYECDNLIDCYNCSFTYNCQGCSNAWFLRDCINCSFCFGCVNLRNKQYYFFNEKCSKDEYLQKINNFTLDLSLQINIAKGALEGHSHILPKKYMNGMQTENCFGDYLNKSKDLKNCFNVKNSQSCAFVYDGYNYKDCYDVDAWGGTGAELVYECQACGDGAYRIICCDCTFNECANIYYSSWCRSCHDVFASIGLRHKQYCILNKQYSKQEYEELVPRIIEHMMKTKEWGEFFHPSLSPFGYNETVAQEYFPLTKKQAQEQGFNWSDYEAPFPKVEKIVKADKLPDIISEIPDQILDWAIECEITHKPFRIIKQELDFYRKHNLPLPKRHPDQRHKDRLSLRNPRKLWNRTCNKCNIPIQTSYSPDRPETVYCEKCYLEAVY